MAETKPPFESPPRLPKKISFATKILVGIILFVSAIIITFKLDDRFNLTARLSQLTPSNDSITLLATHPVISDTAVIVVRRNGLSEIRLLNYNTRGVDFLFDNLITPSFGPVPSPVDARIAYFTNDDAGQQALFVVQPGKVPTDTVSAQTLTSGLEICDYSQPIWSPNGGQIALFVCSQEKNISNLLVTEIGRKNWVIEATEDHLNRVRSAVWVDVNRILFTKSENELDVVYILNTSDTNNKPVRILGP